MANGKASEMVGYAVKHGFLPPVKTLKCVDCGKQATDYDHRNYDYPIGVDATCRSCNIKRGKASGTHDDKSGKCYIYAEVPKEIKKKAERMAKKADLSLRQWLKKAIIEAK